jgi:hypothetical protein
LTLDQLTAAWASTDTLTIGSVDAGLGWPSPDPAPPHHPAVPANTGSADQHSHGDTTLDEDGRSWGS